MSERKGERGSGGTNWSLDPNSSAGVIAGLSETIGSAVGSDLTEPARTATSVGEGTTTSGDVLEGNSPKDTTSDRVNGGKPSGTTERELALDQLFEILKNRRRREVIHYLDRNGGEATLGSLAEYIAAEENDTTVKQITSSQRKRVYVGLYQCHLPKMDDMDIVEFEKNRGTIELGPNASLLQPYLDQGGSERNWHRLYAGLAGTGFSLVVLSTVLMGSVGVTAMVALLTFVGIGGVSLDQIRKD